MNKSKEYKVRFVADDLLKDSAFTRSLCNIISAYMKGCRGIVYGGEPNHNDGIIKKGSYPFIPIHSTLTQLGIFRAILDVLSYESQKYSDVHFVDAGCGIGNIMLLAREVGFVAHGIEYDPRLVKMAKNLLFSWPGGPSHNVIKGDLLKHKKRWKDYDVIYYYCPMGDQKMESAFEEAVEDNMKVGAFIVANMKQSHRVYKDERFQPCQFVDRNKKRVPQSGAIYRKVKEG